MITLSLNFPLILAAIQIISQYNLHLYAIKWTHGKIFFIIQSKMNKNKVSINSNGDFLINDKISTEYTFQQNYYWLMGDNRHGSADSRCWGFVPEDHVVGTASFVWFSKHPETGIRWDRIFSTVH